MPYEPPSAPRPMRRRRLFTAEVEPAEGAEIAGSSRGKGDGEIAASLEAAEEVETIERSRGEYGEIATRARSGVSSPPPTHNEYLLEMRDLGMTTDSPRSTSSAATAHSRPRPGRISAGRAAKLDSLAAPRWKVMTDLSTEPSACDSRSRISAASTGSRVGESTRLVQRQPLSRRANPSAHSILFAQRTRSNRSSERDVRPDQCTENLDFTPSYSGRFCFHIASNCLYTGDR